MYTVRSPVSKSFLPLSGCSFPSAKCLFTPTSSWLLSHNLFTWVSLCLPSMLPSFCLSSLLECKGFRAEIVPYSVSTVPHTMRFYSQLTSLDATIIQIIINNNNTLSIWHTKLIQPDVWDTFSLTSVPLFAQFAGILFGYATDTTSR